jgi:glycosyltransferase involved in cell wall biosynthesis
MLRREGFEPDVINAHEFQAGVAARLLGLRQNRPVVVTEHWSGFLTGAITPRQMRLARFAFGGKVTAAPVSSALAEGIAARRLARTMTIIPNPVDTDTFSPVPPRDPWPEGEQHLLFVGRLVEIKALPVLLEAFRQVAGRHPGAVLDLIGDGPDRDFLETAVADRDLAGRVVFHGSLPPSEVVEFIRRSTGVVLASRHETFGAVLLEAMACGRPVVATRTCGAAPVVSEYGQIVLPPGESDPLAAALEQLLAEPAAIDHGMADGIRSDFGFEAIGARYDALYRSLRGE